MTHYNSLGVEPDATPEQIKQAYRDKAKNHHPDKGGDPVEFAPIAHAYEVLKDPVRRQLYDVSGEDKRKPIEIEVQDVLLQLFNQALSSERDVELLAAVRNVITTKQSQMPAERKKLTKCKKKLALKRGKITSSGPVNVVHLIIDGELKNIDAALANLEHQHEVGEACLVALESYSEEWKDPEPKPIVHSGWTLHDMRGHRIIDHLEDL